MPAAHSVIDGADSPSTYGTPRPPPTESSGNPKGSAKSTRTSTTREKAPTSNTWLPIWACSPTSSTASDAVARSTAASARPDDTVKPNLESSWPVATNSWVWASTPGVIRNRT